MWSIEMNKPDFEASIMLCIDDKNLQEKRHIKKNKIPCIVSYES
jgi:hypothetical protein